MITHTPTKSIISQTAPKKINKNKIKKIHKETQLVRTLVRQSRPLHYITPIFANNRSNFTSNTNITSRPRFAYHHQHSTNSVPAIMGSPYYRDMDEPTSPAGGAHHRSRSASRPPISHSMDYPSEYLSQ